mmetsp:Transcript_34938/g.87847  ORF Transcript_34938/g.87847 Transcript_34938/m.87847 type:complete len:92 (-) Transcript_34938:36-311(-)
MDDSARLVARTLAWPPVRASRADGALEWLELDGTAARMSCRTCSLQARFQHVSLVRVYVPLVSCRRTHVSRGCRLSNTPNKRSPAGRRGEI